jgi:MFS family permease
MNIKNFLNPDKNENKQISPIIFLLTFADIFTWGGYNIFISLLALILAIQFGSTPNEIATIVGIGLAVRFLSRGIFQIPAGIVADKLKKDGDEVLVLGVGIVIMSMSIISISFITSPAQYYVAEFVLGFGSALNLVNWRKLFAKNLSKHKEGISYGIYETAMSISIAVFAAISGLLVGFSDENVFDTIVIAIGLIILSSNLFVYVIMTIEKNLNNA